MVDANEHVQDGFEGMATGMPFFFSQVFSDMVMFCGTIAPNEIGDSLDSEEDADMRRMSMSCFFLFLEGGLHCT